MGPDLFSFIAERQAATPMKYSEIDSFGAPLKYAFQSDDATRSAGAPPVRSLSTPMSISDGFTASSDFLHICPGAIPQTRGTSTRRDIDFGMGNPDPAPPASYRQKLIEASRKPESPLFRLAGHHQSFARVITGWYKRTMTWSWIPRPKRSSPSGRRRSAHFGSGHVGPGDVVLTRRPIPFMYSFIIAGGEVRGIELRQDSDFFDDLLRVYRQTLPRPRILVINFPHNPRPRWSISSSLKIVAFAKEHDVIVIHDLAYADIAFDGYKGAEFSAGAGGQRCGRRVLHLVQSLQHARVASRILCR